tara:strand:+ start:350 stop:796 length:447 start_codon:yes stop_codon:yes gene_type:complete
MLANMQNRDWIIDKLESLVKLCKDTEPDQPDDVSLFTPYTVDAYNLLDRAEDYNLSKAELVDVMKEANRIWKVRKKVLNGEWDDLATAQLIGETEEFVKKGTKIAAIKHYRNKGEQVFGKKITLKEAKCVVDKLHDAMIAKGIIVAPR